MEQENPVYSPKVIEFVAVAAESVSFFENAAGFRRKDFLTRLSKLLPLIYLKMNMIPDFEPMFDDGLEQFVTEQEYDAVRGAVAGLLGELDTFVDYVYVDDGWSDLSEASTATVSESVADIFQDLKDFSMRYQIGTEDVMNDSVALCQQSFRDYWGLKLLSAQKAIHHAIYALDLPDDEPENGGEEECTCGHHHHHHDEHCHCHEPHDSFLHRRINDMQNDDSDAENWED